MWSLREAALAVAEQLIRAVPGISGDTVTPAHEWRVSETERVGSEDKKKQTGH